MPSARATYALLRDQLAADIQAARPSCAEIAFVQDRRPVEGINDYAQVTLAEIPMQFDSIKELEQTWEFLILLVVPWQDPPPADELEYVLGIADALVLRLESSAQYATVGYRPHVFLIDPTIAPEAERTNEVLIGFRCFTARQHGT